MDDKTLVEIRANTLLRLYMSYSPRTPDFARCQHIIGPPRCIVNAYLDFRQINLGDPVYTWMLLYNKSQLGWHKPTPKPLQITVVELIDLINRTVDALVVTYCPDKTNEDTSTLWDTQAVHELNQRYYERTRKQKQSHKEQEQ